jgi:hypothetical protein
MMAASVIIAKGLGEETPDVLQRLAISSLRAVSRVAHAKQAFTLCTLVYYSN